MFEKLKDKIEIVRENSGKGRFEIEKSKEKICEGDEIYIKVKREPLSKKSSSFKTHELKIDENNGIVSLVPTVGLRVGLIFIVLLIFISFIAMVSDIKINSLKTLIIFMGVTIIAIHSLIELLKSKNYIIFNLNNQVFYKSRQNYGGCPENEGVSFKKICAIQLLSKYNKDSDKSFYSYEMNLVLINGQRINLIDHSNLISIKNDSKILCNYLKVPLWDEID